MLHDVACVLGGRESSEARTQDKATKAWWAHVEPTVTGPGGVAVSRRATLDE